MGSRVKGAAGVLFAVLILGLVGRMDYDDAVAQQEYCDGMAADGYWPAEVCE